MVEAENVDFAALSGTFEREDEWRHALAACHWKTKRPENAETDEAEAVGPYVASETTDFPTGSNSWRAR